jgi:hypothetical protein
VLKLVRVPFDGDPVPVVARPVEIIADLVVAEELLRVLERQNLLVAVALGEPGR